MKDTFLLPADSQGRELMEAEMLLHSDGSLGIQVGKSILGAPIKAYAIGRGRRVILLVGAHHGAEHITANILYATADTLLTECGSILGIELSNLLEKFCFFTVPVLNPDGVELSLHGPAPSPLEARQKAMCPDGDFTIWQANARGVDLNHNYDAGFAEYKRIEREEGIAPGRTKYSGEYPESEPESRCAAGLVRALSPEAVVSLHTQGEEIFFSPREDGRCVHIAESLSRITGYRLSQPSGTAAYGGLCDYTGSLGIPSFTIECGRGENPLSVSEISGIFARILPAIVCLPTLL